MDPLLFFQILTLLITAYLRLAKVVREQLGVSTILGLTATAPDATLSDCATRLGVCPNTGIVRGPFMPDNLILTVSKDKDREKALVELLKSPPFDTFDSIIIYCTRFLNLKSFKQVDSARRSVCLFSNNYQLDQPVFTFFDIWVNFSRMRWRPISTSFCRV